MAERSHGFATPAVRQSSPGRLPSWGGDGVEPGQALVALTQAECSMHVLKRHGFSGFARLSEELARSSPVLSNTRELHSRMSDVVLPSLGTMHHRQLFQVFGFSESRRHQEALLMPTPRNAGKLLPGS